jgi:hypothetical protein
MGCNTNTASPTKLSYHNQHSQIYYRSYDNGVWTTFMNINSYSCLLTNIYVFHYHCIKRRKAETYSPNDLSVIRYT